LTQNVKCNNLKSCVYFKWYILTNDSVRAIQSRQFCLAPRLAGPAGVGKKVSVENHTRSTRSASARLDTSITTTASIFSTNAVTTAAIAATARNRDQFCQRNCQSLRRFFADNIDLALKPACVLAQPKYRQV
jgi:hypothetical protein